MKTWNCQESRDLNRGVSEVSLFLGSDFLSLCYPPPPPFHRCLKQQYVRKGSSFCVSPNNQAHSSHTHISQYGHSDIVTRSIYRSAPLSISEASKSTQTERIILKSKALPWGSKLPSKWQFCIVLHNPSLVLYIGRVLVYTLKTTLEM